MEAAQLDNRQILRLLRPEQLNPLSASEEVTLQTHVQSIPLEAQ